MWPRSLPVGAELSDKFLEVLCLAEIPVNGGEADVTYLVEIPEGVHHHFPDHLGRDLRLAHALQTPHDAIGGPLYPVGLDRSFAQCDLHGARELVAVEGLALASGFDDGQLAKLHPLKGSEASAAIRAHAATPD